MKLTNEYKERPIIFSGPMVRAILDGRKSQTRRVVKPQPRATHNKPCGGCAEAGRTIYHFFDGGPSSDTDQRTCPYGEAKARKRDRLWVRETFSAYAPAGQEGNWRTGENVTYVYRADNEDADVARWYPCIFLPRHASRITLEITNVRVERLQEISEADIRAEGVDESTIATLADGPKAHREPSLIEAWCHGWDALNAKRGYSWEKNPWVWVIEFKKL